MLKRIIAAATVKLLTLPYAHAHDTTSHKCKKGYVMTSSHTCVKAPK